MLHIACKAKENNVFVIKLKIQEHYQHLWWNAWQKTNTQVTESLPSLDNIVLCFANKYTHS